MTTFFLFISCLDFTYQFYSLSSISYGARLCCGKENDFQKLKEKYILDYSSSSSGFFFIIY